MKSTKPYLYPPYQTRPARCSIVERTGTEEEGEEEDKASIKDIVAKVELKIRGIKRALMFC